jgi:hypothetical protein
MKIKRNEGASVGRLEASWAGKMKREFGLKRRSLTQPQNFPFLLLFSICSIYSCFLFSFLSQFWTSMPNLDLAIQMQQTNNSSMRCKNHICLLTYFKVICQNRTLIQLNSNTFIPQMIKGRTKFLNALFRVYSKHKLTTNGESQGSKQRSWDTVGYIGSGQSSSPV